MSVPLSRQVVRSQTLLATRCPTITRGYAKAAPKSDKKSKPIVESSKASVLSSEQDPQVATRSACLPNTVMDGLTWLKDQKPVIALPDEEYPPWLWTLLKPKVDPKASKASTLQPPQPGTPEAQKALRRENRKNIKALNFMKAQ